MNAQKSAMSVIPGVILIILGVIALSAATFTTLLSVILLGLLIALAGVVIVLDSFKSWWGSWSGLFLHVLLGVLYIVAGMFLIDQPLLGSISITFMLGIFYLVAGVFRLITATSWKMMRWGWNFFNGIIALLLGILILSNWPQSSLFMIGIFVGVDLVFAGWAYLMVRLASK
jgi:uncharacterized membrane protein HdeD (DUF308 family)